MPSMGSGAAEGLQQVLQRLFLEAQQKQQMQIAQDRLGEDARRADMQNDLGRRQLDATEGMRRATLDATVADRQERGADRDAARYIQEGADLRGTLQMMPKGTAIDNPDTIVGMAKRGMGGMLTPVQNEPRFEFSGTQQTENAETGASAREAAQQESERHNRTMERLATTRAASGGTNNKVWITRDGQPLFVAENEVQPGDKPHSRETSTGDTAQDRQRRARADAARGFLGRLNELRTKINTSMGPKAGLTGAVRQGKAAIGMDPDVAEYERERAAGGRALAVAIMGAQNLSDQDAAAWSNMLPGARVDEQTAKRLMDQVEKMLNDSTADAPKPATTGGSSSFKIIREIK